MEKKTAEQILTDARACKRGSRMPGYIDDKMLIEEDDLIILLQAGGKFIPATISQHSEVFIHGVLYQGHHFIATTHYPAHHYNDYVKK